MVNRLNLPAGEGGVGHETSFRSTYFCKKGRKKSPATQERSNQYGAEIHLRIKATHMLAPTRSALRVRRALFTNSHVSRKCRAYAVKSGFTPPEGNRYLLLISQMIAWRPHRCQWILVTPPIHYSNPCARGWEDSEGSVRVLTTPQLMGILATRIGEQAQDCLPSTRPRQELFSSCLASVAGPTTLRVFAQRACGE
jgi:hypothetical protein